MALKPHEPVSVANFQKFNDLGEKWISDYNGGGYIMRIVNMGESPVNGKISFSSLLNISEIHEVSLLELPFDEESVKNAAPINFNKEKGTLESIWRPFEIRTFLLY